MKIYTKTGDKGKTSLVGGTRVPKYHQRIEAYGTVDELNSYIGLIRSGEVEENEKQILIKIQNTLFNLGAVLALENEKKDKIKLPQVNSDDVELLEKEIDKINEELPPLNNFILPGGNTVVSFCHIARCICRRVERLCVKLREENLTEDINLHYLNRLSDYLFVLARKLSKDLKAEEIEWEK